MHTYTKNMFAKNVYTHTYIFIVLCIMYIYV